MKIVIVPFEPPPEPPRREDPLAPPQTKVLAGGAPIHLAGGPQAAPPLLPKPGEKRAVITSQASTLEQFLEDAPELRQSLQLLVG